MDKMAIWLYLLLNEPVINIEGKEYSVCCPNNDVFYVTDEDSNEYKFHGINALVDSWIIDGKPFSSYIDSIILT